MKVEIQINPDIKEPCAQLHISKLTPGLEAVIKILESEGQTLHLTGTKDKKLFVIEPNSVEIIRTEGRDLILYNRKKEKFIMSKPLYELQNFLSDDFIRISKSAIVNIQYIDHVSATFNGTMDVVMKNGINDVITRSYRNEFKKRLGV